MKRSEINKALKELEAMCAREHCYLPPFCHFTPEEWQPVSLEGKGTEYFDVYVNGKLASSFKVDFSAATGERITLRFTVDG